jgi:histidyl-tRNA synthetase
LQHLSKIGHDLIFKSPNTLEHLSDQSRKHFRDIIEFLDMSEAHYEIDTKMLGHHEYYSDAIFDIVFDTNTSSAPVTIKGGRYDEFVFRKTKKRISAAGSVVILHNKTLPNRLPKYKKNNADTFIIQLGFGPKIRTLLLIDELRRTGIRVHHDLANDSLSAQLRKAENMGVKYVLIMGQKEYVDGTIIMRDMVARKQEAIQPDVAIKRLKRQLTSSLFR